jgi:phenylpropionate dioxygenase-like ring-hydroxylating dioxygenase large terminal subunit
VSERYPFSPFPRGWYHVASAAALPPRKVVPLRRLGRDLVLFRTKSGAAALLDAHCPHQGAHLGHGGRVNGEALVCPFHGWRFDAAGRCVAVPCADALPQGAQVRRWPLVERGGGLIAGFGVAEGSAPDEIPELADPAWSRIAERAWEIRTHVHEAVENLVDAAHFFTLHHTPTNPVTEFTPDGDRARIASRLAMGSVDGPVATELDAEGHGLGWWVLRFHGIAEMVVLTTATPIDAETIEFRLVFWSRDDAAAGAAFAESVCVQVEQDRRVWENKVFRESPLLTSADGPILPFRRWARRFQPA